MARFLNPCILLYFLALITASKQQVIPVVSFFFFEFLNGIKSKFIKDSLDAAIGKFPKKSHISPNKEVLSEIVKLGYMLEATSDTILRGIQNARATVVHEVYKNDLSQYINFVNDEYRMALNVVFKKALGSTKSYAEKWIDYYGELRKNLKHIDGVVENYLRTTADASKVHILCKCLLKLLLFIDLIVKM